MYTASSGSNKSIVGAAAAALALLNATPSHSQTSLAPSRTFQVPPPNPAEIASKWKDAIGAIQWMTNLKLEESLRADLDRARDTSLEVARPLIDWSDQGVLFKVVVARATSPNTGGWFDARIVGDGPVMIGPGSTPEEAMFVHEFARANMYTSVPEGYAYDPTYSSYYWVSKAGDGRLQWKVVPRGMASDLHQSVKDNYDQLQHRHAAERLMAKDLWLRMATVAQQKIADEATRSNVAESARVLAESADRVRLIEQKLNAALQESKKLEGLQKTLAALSTTLSAAELAQSATSTLGKDIPGVSNATTPKQVVDSVTAYAHDNKALIVRVRTDFESQKIAVETHLREFSDTLKPANPPPVLLQNLFFSPKLAKP